MLPLQSDLSPLTSDLSPLTSQLVSERRTRADYGRGPLAHGMDRAAVQALRNRKLCCTVGAGGLSLKSVEGLPTASALPEVANRRAGFARRASEPLPTRQLCETQQRL